MLDPLTNLFGKLQPDIRTRLTAVILTPNQQTWENAYSIILNGESFTTLWKAVIAVDPSFPRSKRMEGEWPAVPSRDTISKAILYAMPMMKTVI
jgi:hypothetical protein